MAQNAMASAGRTTIFDVCGTLFSEDTTSGLLQWHCRRKGLIFRRLLLMALFRPVSPVNWAFRLFERIAGRHWAKILGVRVLAGQSVTQVSESSAEYVEHLLANRRISRVFEAFESAVPTSRVILASASLEPVIKELASRYQVEFVSTRLHTQNDYYTGVIHRDISGQKLEVIRELYGPQVLSGSTCCFTDNLGDRDLVEACSSRYIVLHAPGHRNRWLVPEVTFIDAF